MCLLVKYICLVFRCIVRSLSANEKEGQGKKHVFSLRDLKLRECIAIYESIGLNITQCSLGNRQQKTF